MKNIFTTISVLFLGTLIASAEEGSFNVTINADTQNYTDLLEAFKDAQNAESATVTLLKDITLEDETFFAIIEKGDVTLDLNGHIINSNMESEIIINNERTSVGTINVYGGKLTIIDSDKDKKGTINNTSLKKGITIVQHDGEIVINGGNFSSYYTLDSWGGIMTINNGTFNGTMNAIFLEGGNIDIYGGSIVGDEEGIWIFSGNVTTYGGYIKQVSFTPSSDGTFIIADGYSFIDKNNDSNSLEGVQTSNITFGGTTQKKIVALLSDGETIKSFYYIKDAFTEAQTVENASILLVNNETIKKDTCATIIKQGNIVLDLNGYSISGNLDGEFTEIAGWEHNSVGLINIEGGTLYINDSSEGKTGKITNTCAEYSTVLQQNGGNVNINEGTFVADYAIGSDKGNMCIIGGNFQGTTYDLIINDGRVELIGGIFTKGSSENFASIAIGYLGEGYAIIPEGYIFKADDSAIDDIEGKITSNINYSGKVIEKQSTAINNNTIDKATKTIKTIKDGRIVIIKNGIEYDVNGSYKL